jgi:hypothetical protein
VGDAPRATCLAVVGRETRLRDGGLFEVVKCVYEEDYSVLCDESGHTKFPFFVPRSRDNDHPGSGLGQDLLRLRSISGRLRRRRQTAAINSAELLGPDGCTSTTLSLKL